MLQNKEFHAVIKTKTNTYQWYEKWIKYSYFRPTSSFSRWRQLTTLPRNSCSDFPISMIVHVKVKNMAKYFILMASILNTRCILDTCRRKKSKLSRKSSVFEENKICRSFLLHFWKADFNHIVELDFICK